MNSRERINDLIIRGEKHKGTLFTENLADAAALRELDRLISEYCGMIDEYKKGKHEVVTPSMILLRNQCREAGY